jgi:hypothetical protein
MKCQECDSTVFISEESWSIAKTVTIDLHSGEVMDSDFDEFSADYRDSGLWKCENGHHASYELTDALYDVYHSYFS